MPVPNQLPISVVGVYPKPSYLPIPTWYVDGVADESYMSCDKYEEYMSSLTEVEGVNLDECLQKAQKEVVEAQVNYGIDIITDGEIYRDVYVFHFLRQCDGVDFKNAEHTTYRNGACHATLPVVSGAVSLNKEKVGFMADIWENCQALTSNPVKVTLPGPMTITNTSIRRYYQTERESCEAFAKCLQEEVNALVDRGCKYIQIDEPLIARKNEAASEYGIGLLSGILKSLPLSVSSTVHICCGYTDRLDQEGYEKANPATYTDLSDILDDMGASVISIEGAFCNLDLSVLSRYAKTTIMLGVISVCKSRVESLEEIEGTIRKALEYTVPERLMIAPDCGLGLLPPKTLHEKLTNMAQAVRNIRSEL